MKIYKNEGNTIVVGIRGTAISESDDLKADALLAVGQLETANRYIRDLETLQQVQLTYPPSEYDYYGVGHSLGGAILDMFLKNGLIQKGVSYNPAVQPQDFNQTSLQNDRVYVEGDPLYAIMGKHLSQKPEVRPPRKKSAWEQLGSYVPYVGPALMSGYDLHQSHILSNFDGGRLYGMPTIRRKRADK
jgi:alpha-beta hydrolase superfamily lysophospholipase